MGHGPRARGGRWLAPAWALCLAVGCTSPVRGGLDEDQANQLVVALERASIAATKEPDGRRGAFRVEVARGDLARALTTLEDAGLPRPNPPGYETLLEAPGLVSTPGEERARWLVATAGELARSLEAVDRVASARVHLGRSAPPMLDAPAPPGGAVVLIERRHGTRPLDVGMVQRLVAGSVVGLDASRVEVLQLEARPSSPVARELASLGPFRVAAADAGTLRWLLGGALAIDAALALALALLIWRRRRA